MNWSESLMNAQHHHRQEEGCEDKSADDSTFSKGEVDEQPCEALHQQG